MEYTEDSKAGSVERVEDLGSTPRAQVKRWLLELKIADKTEKEWRKDAQKTLDRYRGAGTKRDRVNILWSNTETLRPALYNSLPNPDVRRRFKDKDPVGKLASTITERCLEYAMDTTAFDDVIKADVLDMLLPGRGLSRIRYVPSFTQAGTPEGHDEEAEEPTQEPQEGTQEELVWEQVDIEHVQWDDFRRGPGKSWDEVNWIGFRHRMTRDDLVKLNPDIGEQIELDSADDDEIRKEDVSVQNLFKTCEVWEIWYKEERKVYFVAESYKDAPIKVEDDPLNLLNFWPIPRPLQAVEDAASLIPITLFSLYEDQAAELDAISARITKLIKGMKLRGVYDSTIAELSQVMRGDDNDLIPAQNVSALLERGGLEKAIWMLPIEPTAKVLVQLYSQREQIKQTIYDITGISDIIRGSTVASETATAQQIKNKWGTLRIQRMQYEVQRYIRDLFRLMGEVICEKFTPQTLAAQTLLPIEQIMVAMPVMQSDMMREFHIDIETDSTVAASQQEDMQSLRELLTGVVEFINGIGPAVQMKAIPIEAVKEVLLAVLRRSKLGSAVEDAFDGVQEPQAQGMNPEQIKQAKQQYEQTIQQLQGQMQQLQEQAGKAIQQAQMEAQKAHQELQEIKQDASIKVYEVDKRAESDANKVNAEIEKAKISAQVQLMLKDFEQKMEEMKITEETSETVMEALTQMQERIESMQTVSIKPIRDENGRLVGGVKVMADGTETNVKIGE